LADWDREPSPPPPLNHFSPIYYRLSDAVIEQLEKDLDARGQFIANEHELFQKLDLVQPDRFMLQMSGEVVEWYRKLVDLSSHLMITPPSPTLQQLAKVFTAVGFDRAKVSSAISYYDSESSHIFCVPLDNMPAPPASIQASAATKVYFSHGTSFRGLLGILKLGILLPADPDPQDEEPPTGFFASASLWEADLPVVVFKRSQTSKNQCGFLICGTVISRTSPHSTIKEGGVVAEQRACNMTGIAHNTKEHRWCLASDRSTVTSIWFVSPKPASEIVSKR
jgi:hypothetical protein